MALLPSQFLHRPLSPPGRSARVGGAPVDGAGIQRHRLSWHSPLLALAVAGLVLAGTWAAIYVSAKDSLTQTADDHLAAVATLKAAQIGQWLDERKTDAALITHAPLFAETLKKWLASGRRDDAARDLLLGHMRNLAIGAHYRDISIRSVEDGAQLLSTGGDLVDSTEVRRQAKTAAAHARIEDMHFTYPGVSTIDLGIFNPVILGNSAPVAILHITIDPTARLFPLMQDWPGSSPSAETLLVRVEGDELVYLNNLRHLPDLALRFRQHLTETPQLLAAQAGAGARGPLKGVDYRGVRSLGYALAVDETPWLLIAKIDEAEVYGQLNRLAVFGIAVTALLLLLGAWWIAERNRLSLARYRDQLEHGLLSKRIAFLAQYANDSILLLDPHGCIAEVNDRALDHYGYTLDEMLGMDIAQLRAPGAQGEAAKQLASLAGDGGLIFETEHRARNGRQFPVEVSVRRIEVAGEIHTQEIVRDISRRVEADRALRASEERFRRLFDLAPLGTAIVAPDGRFESTNVELCRLTGQGMNELRDLSLADVTHADDREQEREMWAQLAAGTLAGYTLEKRLDHAAGHAVWVQQDLAVVKDETGAPLHFIAQFLDISERKIFVERIERLSRLNAAMSRTNDAIIHSRAPEEVFAAVCAACVELGHLPLAFVAVADAESKRVVPVAAAGAASGFLDGCVMSTAADTPRGCGPEGIAYREQRLYVCPDYLADPDTTPCRQRAAAYGLASSVSLPLARGGKPYGALTVYGAEKNFFDVEAIHSLHRMADNVSFALDNFDRYAQRQEAQRLLAVSAAQVDDLYQNSPCGYHSIDGDGMIVRINDTELRWLGYTREEVVGRMHVRDLMSEKGRRTFDATFPKFKTDGVVVDTEFEMQHKDGTTLPVLINASVVRDAEGNFGYSRTTVIDITERKKLEAERIAAAARTQTLSRRLVAVQEDERRRLAEALHDDTSPNLAAIGIILGRLRVTLPPGTDAATEAGIEDARALLKDTAANVREICTSLRPSLLDYSGLLPSLTSYAQQFGKRTGIVVHVMAQDNFGRLETEIESLLFRITLEALTNCAKHAFAKSVDIVLSHAGGEVVLMVSDDGFGFDPQQLGQPGSSPGLGLLTMRERAEFAGGTFSIDSRPGQGTTILVRLEAAMAAGDSADPAAPVQRSAASLLAKAKKSGRLKPRRSSSLDSGLL